MAARRHFRSFPGDHAIDSSDGTASNIDPHPRLSTGTQPPVSSDEVDSGAEAQNDESREMEIIRRWKESPFAVGLTEPTWADEDVRLCYIIPDCCTEGRQVHLAISGLCCKRAGRLGNMVVLKQRTEQITDSSGNTYARPRIVCVVGPYWSVLTFCTVPLLLAFSLWSAITRVPKFDWPIVMVWASVNMFVFVALFMVGCRDPGIVYRQADPPPGEESNWRWNDQALTYRPPNARFDPECGVVIDGFDHTCPWTSTAIGKNNMMCFRLFLLSVVATILFNLVILTWL